MITSLCLMAALGAAVVVGPQEPGSKPVVARYLLRGEPAVVTETDLALEVAFRMRRGKDGADAVRLLVDRYLVETAARDAGLGASEEEIEAQVGVIRGMLEEQGATLEVYLEAKGMSWERFVQEYVTLSIEHEKLVRAALDLDEDEEVRPEMLQLWLQEARNKGEVVEDQDQMPPGVVARIGEHEIGTVELGQVLASNLTAEDRFGHVRRLVLRRTLNAEARELGIQVSQEETRAEVEIRRAAINQDPKYRGVDYDSWLLQTQGITVEDLLNSDQMVATVQHLEIIKLRYPDEELRKKLAAERDEVLARHGEQRKIGLILVRALEEPNEAISRDFDAAHDRIVEAIERMAKGETFETVAKIFSEDPGSKVRGGDLGMFFRADPSLPEPLREAAWQLRRNEVSEPLRLELGWALVRVSDIEPAPDDALLIERMRDQLGRDMLEQIVEDAKIEMNQG